ncbi:hypothetical protein RND61_05215 [Streptomyces sp. TRM76323]|uniref:Uncharacterized protein n=1 Tax=Streptomyces tamarix TaxID=3078565 RepID=A0ABU3QFD9_9ACTN|nr:hypothetical protein [Streptomyces tamarix]MDT9681474.1 hypothetical protein [Streptomyces tamarix]
MSPETAGYGCEVRAEGPVYGTGETAQYVLGTFQTISPVLALRWLRGEALRIADRLDPDPNRSAWVRPAMRQGTAAAPDCPTELRVWADGLEEQRAAREGIKGGDPLFVVVRDTDCAYTLSVWPVRLPTNDLGPPWPESVCHRVGGVSRPLYVLAGDPWRQGRAPYPS